MLIGLYIIMLWKTFSFYREVKGLSVELPAVRRALRFIREILIWGMVFEDYLF